MITLLITLYFIIAILVFFISLIVEDNTIDENNISTRILFTSILWPLIFIVFLIGDDEDEDEDDDNPK